MIKVDGIEYVKKSTYDTVTSLIILWFIASYLIAGNVFKILTIPISIGVFMLSLLVFVLYYDIKIRVKKHKESSV